MENKQTLWSTWSNGTLQLIESNHLSRVPLIKYQEKVEKLSYRHLNPRKCYCGSDEKYRGFHTITNISNGICCELQMRKEGDIIRIKFKVNKPTRKLNVRTENVRNNSLAM